MPFACVSPHQRPPFGWRVYSWTVIVRRALRWILPPRLALALRRQWLARRVATEAGRLEGEIQLLPRFVRPTDVCWDIGANAGTYALALSPLASRVFAFEPIPHNVGILEQVKKRARLHNVSIQRVAIGDIDGPGRMTIPIDGFYGGYYLAALDDGGSLSVSIASIDVLIANGLPQPDFIKCDVEGAETRVINGARSLIARRHPIWLLETFEDDVLPLMQSLGYVAHIHVGHANIERVLVRDARHRNYLFLPARDATP
jgi:FkbM family methyltransferase